jgi:hypothetical protein
VNAEPELLLLERRLWRQWLGEVVVVLVVMVTTVPRRKSWRRSNHQSHGLLSLFWCAPSWLFLLLEQYVFFISVPERIELLLLLPELLLLLFLNFYFSCGRFFSPGFLQKKRGR